MPKVSADETEDWTWVIGLVLSKNGVCIVQITEGRMFKGNLRAICGIHEEPILWNGTGWHCLFKGCSKNYTGIKSGAAVCHESIEAAHIADWVSAWTEIPPGQLTVKVKP